jgi:hypothetical protein
MQPSAILMHGNLLENAYVIPRETDYGTAEYRHRSQGFIDRFAEQQRA